MAKLSTDDVRHVAKNLAKIDLTDEELKKFTPQLAEVLDYMSVLNEVDTDGVEPTSQTTGLTNVTREDKVDATSILTQDEALSGTEETHNGYFKVAAVLNK